MQFTPGADFVPGLQRNRWAAVFQKGTDPSVDSYSGFFDNAKQRAPALKTTSGSAASPTSMSLVSLLTTVRSSPLSRR
jgi:nicotinamidase-related amidase